MRAHADVVKTPTAREVGREIGADATVNLKEKIVNGGWAECSIDNRDFGAGHALGKQWRERLVAQDSDGGVDVSGGCVPGG